MTHATLPALSMGGTAIRQHGGLYSLNDLHKASGGEIKHQPTRFIRLDTTQALIAEISNSPDMVNYRLLESIRGKFGGTYACRELVISYASWISAEFHLKVIRVFLDAVAPAAPQPAAQPPAHTIEQAYRLANQTATIVADQVYRAALAGRFTGMNRCLFLISGNGTKVTPVDPRAHIFTPAQITTSLRSGDVLAAFSDIELTNLAQAVMERVKFRLGKSAPRALSGNQPTAAVALTA